MKFEVSHAPDKTDLAAVYQGLLAFNLPHFPGISEDDFACFIRDDDNRLLGGLIGSRTPDTLHINYLWLDESVRGQGLGRELLARAEAEVELLGVKRVYLDTFSFQAPQFYQKQGYRESGRFESFPVDGVDKIFFVKQLNYTPSRATWSS